jgi:hypothetical protein
MNLVGRNQIDFSRTYLHVHGLVDVRVVRLGTIVGPLVALDGLGAVEHSVKGPVMRMIVNLRSGLWRFDQTIDNESILSQRWN